MEYRATDHAYDRAKERLRWNAKTLDRMMAKAFEKGIKHADTKADLKKHLDDLLIRYNYINASRIHGEVIFFFVEEKENDKVRLITLYRLPNELLKQLKYIK